MNPRLAGAQTDAARYIYNVIGGTAVEEGNIIAHNAAAGVIVLPGTWTTIAANSIYANGALGIDLGGDGVSDLAEYLAGTNPTDNTSFFRITHFAAGVTNWVTFTSSSNRS